MNRFAIRRRWLLLSTLLAVLGCASPATSRANDLWGELFEPFEDKHSSGAGTPYVHSFFVEPAFTGRHLFLDYRLGSAVDGAANVQEIEMELEWALTKRLTMVVEAPYQLLNPDVDPNTAGFADMAFAGRLLAYRDDCFLAAINVEVEAPTGDVDRGLGRGETAISPTLLLWRDLGRWTTFQAQIGPEVGLESGETEMIYNLSIARSFKGPLFWRHACGCGGESESHDDHDEHGHDDEHDDHGNGGHDHAHVQPGLLSLILEATGTSNLSDPSEPTYFELLPGVSYAITEQWEVRLGARVPLFKPKRMDAEYIFSVIRHF